MCKRRPKFHVNFLSECRTYGQITYIIFTILWRQMTPTTGEVGLNLTADSFHCSPYQQYPLTIISPALLPQDYLLSGVLKFIPFVSELSPAIICTYSSHAYETLDISSLRCFDLRPQHHPVTSSFHSHLPS